MPTALLVSVIVPVRDGGRDLETLVGALEAQTLPRDRFEVIVADDGSTDGATAGLETPEGWLRVTPGPPLNAFAARNRGAALARSATLAFCDADTRPEPGWLEAGLAALEAAGAVAGRIRLLPPPRPTVWTLLDVDRSFDQEAWVARGGALTANLLVGRELFERVGGFDESFPYEGDVDFARRCVATGARLAYAPGAVVGHPTRDRAAAYLGKVWAANRWASAGAVRAGRRADVLGHRALAPLAATRRSRQAEGRPGGLDRARLAAHGLSPGRLDGLRALPLMYGVVPGVAAMARLRGWWDGRRSPPRSGG